MRPRTPGIGSFGAGAGRCLPLHTPCMCSLCADADTSIVASLAPLRPPPCLWPHRVYCGSRVPSWGHICLASPPTSPHRASASLSPRRPPQARLARVAYPPLHRPFPPSLRILLLASCLRVPVGLRLSQGLAWGSRWCLPVTNLSAAGRTHTLAYASAHCTLLTHACRYSIAVPESKSSSQQRLSEIRPARWLDAMLPRV